MVQVDGRQYAFPCNVYGTVLFYNKALFSKYGVPCPPRDWTWDAFVAAGSKLTVKSADGRGYDCFGAMGLHWYELVLQAGGTMNDPFDILRVELVSPHALTSTLAPA